MSVEAAIVLAVVLVLWAIARSINAAIQNYVDYDLYDVPENREPGYIYVFRGYKESKRFVKIGRGRDALARLKQLRTGNTHGIELLAVRRVASATSAESYIHHRFQHLRYNGEWFRVSFELWLYWRALRDPRLTRELQEELNRNWQS